MGPDWSLKVLLGFYAFLGVLMGSNGCVLVFIFPHRFLYVLMPFYGSICVLMGPSRLL